MPAIIDRYPKALSGIRIRELPIPRIVRTYETAKKQKATIIHRRRTPLFFS
jgi:hypothetical protein